jgi:glucose-1-phosphate thymidylyltransferase
MITLRHKQAVGKKPELSVGDVIQAAIEAGLEVEAIPVSDKSYVDIGTAEGLVDAIEHYAVL